MGLYDDIRFFSVVRKFILYTNAKPFVPETNSIEFIRSGQVTLEHNGSRIELTSPMLFWMFRGDRYRFIVGDKTLPPCEHLYFDFYGPRSDRILASLRELVPQETLVPRDPEKISEILLRMQENFHSDAEEYLPELVADMEQMLLEISRSIRPIAEPQKNVHGMQHIAEVIRRKPFAAYDFRELARMTGISYERYRQLFRQINGLPPRAFVARQVMLRAAELLRTTDMRIKEVMVSCGIPSMMEFSRSFKKFAGVSPKAYRAKYR